MAYNTYFVFYDICLANNVKLFSTSWDEKRETKMYTIDPRDHYKRFFSYDQKELTEFLYKTNNDEKFFLTAMDDIHFGTGYHDFCSNFLFNVYQNDIID